MRVIVLELFGYIAASQHKYVEQLEFECIPLISTSALLKKGVFIRMCKFYSLWV